MSAIGLETAAVAEPATGGATDAPPPAIRARGLAAGYGAAPVVHEIDLDVHRGEVLALIGPNGTGKSTLLRALLGLVPTAAGTVELEGRGLRSLSARERARRVAFLPQETGLDLALPVREIVAMGRYPHRTRWRAHARDEACIRAALDRTGTTSFADRHIGRLSGGQRQLSLVAKLLAQESSTLLLDEPVSALDLGYQLDVLELLRGLAGDGSAVVVVLHDLELAARFCDRLVVLHRGRVQASGTPHDVLTPELLREVYRVDARVELSVATGAPHVTALSRCLPHASNPSPPSPENEGTP